MIYNIKLSTLQEGINTVVEYIQNQRKNNNSFSIIDVGGSRGGWSYQYVDAIIDFNAPKSDGKIKHFSFNINHPNGWKAVEEYIKNHGKFDFSICTHTLEDISNPKYVSEQLSKISKVGYIAVPSKYKEFSRFIETIEGEKIRGNVHHRWIFNFIGDVFFGFPKIPYIEVDTIFNKLANNQKEYENLGFFWKDELMLSIINGDYLGPTQYDVMNMYRTYLFNDDLDKKYNL